MPLETTQPAAYPSRAVDDSKLENGIYVWCVEPWYAGQIESSHKRDPIASLCFLLSKLVCA